MTLTIYHLKTCDTCRKAIKALADRDVNLIDVRADGIDADTLLKLTKAVGWEAMLNTRSTTWRGLEGSVKADMTKAKAVALMGEHPTLIKRPVITDGDVVTVGWTAKQQAQWL